MHSRPIRVALLCLSLLAATRTASLAGTLQNGACFDKTVAAVKLEVDGHPDYPQSLVSGLEVRKDMPFTREAYRRSVERLVRFGSFEEVKVLCAAAAGGVDITFAVVPPHRVTEVAFQGETGLPQGELKDLLRRSYGGLPNIEPQLVATEVRNILEDHGYLQAQVDVKRVTYSDPDRATLIFDVTAGPLAEIGNVNIDLPDEKAITKQRIATITGLIKGRPYRRGPIRDGLQEVVSELKSRGHYLAAFTEPESQPSGDRTFDVTVDVTPGPRVTLAWDPDGESPLPGDINDWIPIKAQNTIDRDMLDDSRDRMRQYLRNQGYADVEVQILGAESGTEWPLKVHITRGPKFRVDSVEFPPSLHMSDKDLRTWLNIHDGDVRNEGKIFAGLSRIRNEYLQVGYYKVGIVLKSDPAPNRLDTDTERWVVLRPEITEGPKGQVVQVEFKRSTSQVPEAALREVMLGLEGHPYIAELDRLDRVEIERLYLNRGFRIAKADIDPEFGSDGTQVKRVVSIDEGPQVHVLDIQVVGWRDISEEAIREELVLRPGAPYGEADRLASRNRLYEMGVFSRVDVEAEDPVRTGDPNYTGAHVIVRVVEAPDTTIAYGGGLEAGQTQRAVTETVNEERFEVYPRGSFEISRRNLGGRNRIVSLFTRLSLRPHDAPHDPLRDGKGYAPSQYRVALTYQERRAWGTDNDWLFGIAAEQVMRSAYNFRRQGANMDLTRLLSQRTRATARYTFDFTQLYKVGNLDETDLLNLDRAIPQVRLSTFGFSVISEQRDDPVSPSRGKFLAWDGEVAARAIGSEVGYVKMLAQASTYKSLVPSKRFILAGRAEVGLARGFEREVALPDPLTGIPTPTLVAELPASQRFFAGGSTTVRGFSLDSLGRPDVLSQSGLSKGGNGLVVLNAELRTRIVNLFRRKLSTAIFVDSGNVFAKVNQMSLPDLRGSVGYGFRYDSPLGPIRVDFGYKLSRLTFANGQLEPGWAYHISFGEIF